VLFPPRNLAAAFLHLLKDLRIFMCGFRSRILFIGLYAVWTTVVVPKSGTHLAASACALHSQFHEVWRVQVSQTPVHTVLAFLFPGAEKGLGDLLGVNFGMRYRGIGLKK